MITVAPGGDQEGAWTMDERSLITRAIPIAITFIETRRYRYTCAAISRAIEEVIVGVNPTEYSTKKVQLSSDLKHKIFDKLKEMGVNPGSCSAFEEFSFEDAIMARIIWLTWVALMFEVGGIDL